ncbi:hypothetical protein N7523_002582 [Penicillium sp. IBT 18751x]|nr:hypothetical protein N7523_002582 [Penicillium sp. IBT 18751x]
MDEFAQTRGADDLFDDEIIPVSAEEQQVQNEVVAPEPESAPKEEVPVIEKQPSPRGDTPQRGRGGERGRARGSGRGRGQGKPRGGLQDSRFADPKLAPTPRRKGPTKTPEPAATPEAKASLPEKPQEAAKEENGGDEENNGTEAPRVPAVRGDRSATGGVRKPKLTEEQLSKKIAAAKELATKKAAAHARAEADHAAFQEREQVAAKKRREEQANRRLMDNEREQNRQRKLKAQTGREWDSEKREEDYNPRGGGSQFRRGMHGGVSGYTRNDFNQGAADDDAGANGTPGRGRGRGGRGRGPSRGPRGERASSKEPSNKADKKAALGVNNEADFPSLPAGKKPEDASESLSTKKPVAPAIKAPPSMENLDSTFSPLTGTWADSLDE